MPVDRTPREAHAAPVDIGQALGEGIRLARGRATQIEFAELLGTDQSTLSKWERGIQRPALETLMQIEDAAGRPRGFILVSAGLVEMPTTFEEVLAMDGRLEEAVKEVILGGLRAAQQQLPR